MRFIDADEFLKKWAKSDEDILKLLIREEGVDVIPYSYIENWSVQNNVDGIPHQVGGIINKLVNDWRKDNK